MTYCEKDTKYLIINILLMQVQLKLDLPEKKAPRDKMSQLLGGKGRGKSKDGGLKERGAGKKVGKGKGKTQGHDQKEMKQRQRGTNGRQGKKLAEFERMMKKSHGAPTERLGRSGFDPEPKRAKKSSRGVRTRRGGHKNSGGRKKRSGGGNKRGSGGKNKGGGHGSRGKGKEGLKSESASSASSGKDDLKHESVDGSERDNVAGRWLYYMK